MEVSWTPGMSLDDVEKRVILKALLFYGGNKERTANALGIAAKTLYNKLALYEQQKEEAKNAKLNGPKELSHDVQRWGHRPDKRHIEEKQGTVLPDVERSAEQQRELALAQEMGASKSRKGKDQEAEGLAAQDGLRAERGQRMEPSAQLSKKPSVPVSKR